MCFIQGSFKMVVFKKFQRSKKAWYSKQVKYVLQLYPIINFLLLNMD